MPGPPALLLLDERGVRQRLHGVAHPIPVAPRHDDAAGPDGGDPLDGVVDETPTAQLVERLGKSRPHAGRFPGGENHGSDRTHSTLDLSMRDASYFVLAFPRACATPSTLSIQTYYEDETAPSRICA